MMKISLILFVFCATVSARTIVDNEPNDDWSSFKLEFQKSYSSVEEETDRRMIWENNAAFIRQHNREAAAGVHSYTLKMNQFGDLTNQEFRRQMNGWKQNLTKNLVGRTFSAEKNFVLPDAIDWRKSGYVTPVKDQGKCGSCWSFSATGSLEGQTFAKRTQLISLSEQNLVDCSHKFGNMGCDGGVMELAFLYIKENNGIDTEISYPYEAHGGKCRFNPKNIGATDRGFVQVKMFNETDLQAAIATIGPISVAIDASKSSFQFYSSGIYNEPQCSPILLDHGVLAVGYDKLASQEYYIVKNSWGTTWGNQGYIWMSRNKKNQCGIATSASYPLV